MRREKGSWYMKGRKGDREGGREGRGSRKGREEEMRERTEERYRKGGCREGKWGGVERGRGERREKGG